MKFIQFIYFIDVRLKINIENYVTNIHKKNHIKNNY